MHENAFGLIPNKRFGVNIVPDVIVINVHFSIFSLLLRTNSSQGVEKLDNVFISLFENLLSKFLGCSLT